MRIGEPTIVLDTIDSTNDYLKRIAGTSIEGTVVLAKQQVRGRGRRGRSWISGASSLTFSFLLKQRAALIMPLMTLGPAIVIAEEMEKKGVPTRIKWPNDLYINRRKIGGILVETVKMKSGEQAGVVGIGINVQGSVENLPESIREKAGTIESETGICLKIDDLFTMMLHGLNEFYDAWSHENSADIRQRWMRNCYHINHRVCIHDDTAKSEGEFVGIDDQGFALIKTDSGAVTLFDVDRFSLEDKHDFNH